MIQTIVVPVDGSEHARKAAGFAADLAARYDAQVILLHVLLQGAIPEGLREMALAEHLTSEGRRRDGPEVANIPARMASVLHDTQSDPNSANLQRIIADQVLRRAEATIRERGASKYETLIEQGSPAKAILKTAEQSGADLIVMGSRGLSDLQGLLVGSVSHKVSHLAKCTCILVK